MISINHYKLSFIIVLVHGNEIMCEKCYETQSLLSVRTDFFILHFSDHASQKYQYTLGSKVKFGTGNDILSCY